jgi:hypothetical protein
MRNEELPGGEPTKAQNYAVATFAVTKPLGSAPLVFIPHSSFLIPHWISSLN